MKLFHENVLEVVDSEVSTKEKFDTLHHMFNYEDLSNDEREYLI